MTERATATARTAASAAPGPAAVPAGRDATAIKPQTGQRRAAAAELPYAKLVLIGTAKRVPSDFGDADGVWPMMLVITSNVAGELRAAQRRSPLHDLEVHAERWGDADRDDLSALKSAFDADLAGKGLKLRDDYGWFNCPPEAALKLLGELAGTRKIRLFDNPEYDRRLDARMKERAEQRFIHRR